MHKSWVWNPKILKGKDQYIAIFYSRGRIWNQYYTRIENLFIIVCLELVVFWRFFKWKFIQKWIQTHFLCGRQNANFTLILSKRQCKVAHPLSSRKVWKKQKKTKKLTWYIPRVLKSSNPDEAKQNILLADYPVLHWAGISRTGSVQSLNMFITSLAPLLFIEPVDMAHESSSWVMIQSKKLDLQTVQISSNISFCVLQ